MSQKLSKTTKKTKKVSKTVKKPAKEPEKKMTWLEQVYAKEGVSTVEELVKKGIDPLKVIRAVGAIPITEFAEFAMGGDAKHDPFIMRNLGKKIPRDWTPRMEQVPRNIEINSKTHQITKNVAFTAAEKKKWGTFKVPDVKQAAKGIGAVFLWPKYWLNPYQYQDYIIFQDNYANTIAGRIIDIIVYFTLANGVKPKLEPRDRTKFKTDEELQKALEKNEWLLDTIEQIEKNISGNGEPKPFVSIDDQKNLKYIPFYNVQANSETATYDTHLQQKWASACTLGLTYGRTAVVPNVDELDDKVTVNIGGSEKTYQGIPKVLQLIHPRDLGFNHVDPRTWKLLGLQLYNSNWILKPDQMIFWEWNPNNPVYGSLFYGYSLQQSMMGSARSLRRIIEVDFPLIAKTRWSGMYWIFFKRKGEGLVTAEQEHQAILKNIRLDGINISLEDDPMNDVKIEKIDLDPKINELIEMCRFLIQYMMAQVGMPQGLLFGEEALNRATLIGKLKSFIQGPIRKYRKWFLDGLTEQWYARLAETLALQDDKIKEILKDFNVIADVEEFVLEDWSDLIQPFMMLSQLNPFKDEEVGKMLHIDNYQSLIDPDKEPPMMSNGGFGKQTVTNEKGKSFTVSDSIN